MRLLPNSDLQRDPNSKLTKAAFLKQVFFSQLKSSISGHAALLPGFNFSKTIKRMEQFGTEVKSVPGLSLFSKALLRGTPYSLPYSE